MRDPFVGFLTRGYDLLLLTVPLDTHNRVPPLAGLHCFKKVKISHYVDTIPQGQASLPMIYSDAASYAAPSKLAI